LIWWFLDDRRMSKTIEVYLDDPEVTVFVSAATAWELTTKFRSGKLQEAAVIAENLPSLITRCRFLPLPITVEHGHRAGLLPGNHKDPFDRMLAAQAIIDDLDLVSADPAMAGFGARVVW
jgi:PIN domain nuclease of toxin-antitoxin system